MNLFILSLIQKEIAQFMMDKHLHKILLEAVQMLCSAKRVLDPEDPINDKLYKLAHKNHPVTIWCRTSKENFIWVLDLVEELHQEWRFRYGHSDKKFHKSYLVSLVLRENIPRDALFEKEELTPFALAMPIEFSIGLLCLLHNSAQKSFLAQQCHIDAGAKRFGSWVFH
jgi:hypothetical protein